MDADYKAKRPACGLTCGLSGNPNAGRLFLLLGVYFPLFFFKKLGFPRGRDLTTMNRSLRMRSLAETTQKSRHSDEDEIAAQVRRSANALYVPLVPVGMSAISRFRAGTVPLPPGVISQMCFVCVGVGWVGDKNKNSLFLS